MKRRGLTFLFSFCFIFIFLIACDKQVEKEREEKYISLSSESIELCKTCPPGFLLNEKNQCISKNLYQQYESLQNVGVGGLKTSLPKVRDGFSPQQIDLGRYLFFDPVLSADGSISCASCHDPDQGFSDGKAISTGIHGAVVDRSSPSLWNVAYLKNFFWDARAPSLEEQMQGPLFSKLEMGNTPKELKLSSDSLKEFLTEFDNAKNEHGV